MRLEFEPNTSTLLFTDKETPEIVAGSSEALRQGIEAAQTGNRARARALLLRVTEVEPRNEEAWLWLASVSEYPEELVIFLGNVLEINPNNERAVEWMKSTKSLLANTFIERGIDAAGSNRKDFARQCFYQAAAHDSKNEMAWLWLASIADTVQEKQTHLTRVLAINPENAEAQAVLKAERERTAQTLLRRASTQALSGDRQSALATLTETLSVLPKFEDALILKAHITDDFAGKIECFENVLEINPSNEAARAGLASLNALRNFAAENDSERETQNFNPFGEFSEANETPAKNEFQEESDFAAEVGFNETNEFEKAEENFFAAPDEGADDENDEMENAVLFTETLFESEPESEENVNFADVSFDSFEENSRIEAESADDFFHIETAAPENVSAFGDEIFGEVTTNSDFPASTGVTDESLALNESEADVFAPDENFTEIDFSIPAVDFPAPVEDSLNESETENAVLEETAKESASLAETDKEVRNEEFPFEACENDDVFQETPESDVKMSENSFACPFCSAENDVQTYACGTCCAVLSLSEMEMLIANENADRDLLELAVERMEDERVAGDFGEYELMSLGIGHVNLKNFRRGLAFLQQASKTNPNNVVLSSQVNAFALRLEEIERREEISDASQPRTILVVDDSATVRKLISGKLEKSGHEVICAVDGMDALAKLEETSPDLILLDITMPRMDGYQVCKMIRSNPSTKNIPVVMISGKDGFFDKVRGRMAGTTGFITKPFGPETLMKALEVYIKNTHEQIVAAEA